MLERVYDLAYLQRSLDTIHDLNLARNAADLQAKLLGLVQQLKPASDVSPGSLAWRLYNALEQRYLRGLTQAEAATELNISLRQLRREQDRGIEAVATLLFLTERQPGAVPEAGERSPAPASASAEPYEFLRLDDLLQAVLGLIDPLLSRKNVDVQVALPQQAPVAWANRTLVRQLLIAAITFAIHGDCGGLLSIQSDLVDHELRLSLTHYTSQPCEPAVSEDSLLELRQLAQQAGFRVTIPDAGPTSMQVLLSIAADARQRVMMIDDNVDAIELTRRYLARTQFDLVAITRAEEALLQAQTLQPSCILLDVMMPGRDGWEVLALLKSHPATIHIPVVVCSVLRNPDLAYALGASAILPRPHTAAQLREMLEHLIGPPPPPLAVQSS